MFKYILLMIILIISSLSRPAKAQITITTSDVQSLYSVGNSYSFSSDSTTKIIDIGAPGSSSWDFSNLRADTTYTVRSIDPAATPFINEFTDANIALNYSLSFMGVSAESFIYFKLDNDLVNLGIASSGSPIPGTTIVSKFTLTPPVIELKLPATIGTSWSQEYIQTNDITVNGNPFQTTTSSVILNNVVDAYGSAKLPGGRTAEVLRIKSDETTFTVSETGQDTIYSRFVSYMFYSKSGDLISITPSDTSEPDNGQINVASISWNQFAVTAVDDNKASVKSFALEQNYPNPFNPSTFIKYSIPEDSFVELKIFDAIGKEVKTLIRGNQQKGEYTFTFDAGNLPSGMYVAKLKAGSLTKSIKMLLMK